MRIIILLMLTITIKAYAGTDIAPLETVPFEGVQHECRQVGGISFGVNGRWADCHVTRGRWVATIDFLDIYQAQYCLGNTPESCEQTAQVIFANRAYTPDATVLLTRLDEAGTSYIDPLIVNSDNDSVMSMTSRSAAGVVATEYFVWGTDHWSKMDAQHWQHDLQARLPKGTSARELSALPDLETMSAAVKLFNTKDLDCCPSGGVAKVTLGLNTAGLDEFHLENRQFIVKSVAIQP